MREIEALNTHKLIAQRQQAAYKKHKEVFSNDTLVIKLDWKQKVVIGNLLFSISNINWRIINNFLIKLKIL